MIKKYFERYGLGLNHLQASIPEDLGIIMVIPVYKESSIISCIKSLLNCKKPNCAVEVLLVFNASADDELAIAVNQSAIKELDIFLQSADATDKWFTIHTLIHNDLSSKHAGVGLARKIGMDEALFRLSDKNLSNGIILCGDADALFSDNYLEEVYTHFNKHINASASSIYFEHPLEGEAFSRDIYSGILFYELHLRYYKQGLAYAGLPFAYHTVGSSMAVRAIDYLKQGGMNRRKAGEDFYFLQKFIKLGTFSELNTCCVFPSPRTSDRVPFGTGRALLEMQNGKRKIEESYDFEIFKVLKSGIKSIEHLYEQDLVVNEFLLEFIGEETWEEKMKELRKNSNSAVSFKKRFFQWFDAFKTLQFVHFLRDNYYPNKKLVNSYQLLLVANEMEVKSLSPKDLLHCARKIDRGEISFGKTSESNLSY